ncbi:MAG TPA: tetratricopeptide repeat protein [Candidatus Sulfotelmatobacter sp.]|nr:tetratricopeptide repeat protein [Candidatus Sulfotelmatobacter sp.]
MSSTRITSRSFVLFLLMATTVPFAHPQASARAAENTRPAAGSSASPAQIFQRGQEALNRNELDAAERDFRQVLQLDPQAGAAYANLGVVYMRKKEWDRALRMLRKAEPLMPDQPGIRMNIGFAYYNQNEFLRAVPPLESVVQDEPEAVQPRYVLGLCYFYAEKWADAATTLEPLWEHESRNQMYFYVLANAAHRAGRKDLDERASEQFLKLGADTAESHLFVGKYRLESGQFDRAIAEFNAAAERNPKLDLVHFYLGLAHLKKQEYDTARDEFLKDAAIEPDLALNYDYLGQVYWLMQDDQNAEKSYRTALHRDSRLVDSHLGLAKIYQKQQKYPAALAEADAAVKFDPARPDTHYVRGQALLHLDRKQEAKKELDEATRIQNERGSQLPAETLPSPELKLQPQ